MLNDDEEAAPVVQVEGPRRRLWIFVLLCCYTFTAVALDQAARLSESQQIATVAVMIYVVFSPVLWVVLYWQVGDW